MSETPLEAYWAESRRRWFRFILWEVEHWQDCHEGATPTLTELTMPPFNYTESFAREFLLWRIEQQEGVRYETL